MYLANLQKSIFLHENNRIFCLQFFHVQIIHRHCYPKHFLYQNKKIKIEIFSIKSFFVQKCIQIEIENISSESKHFLYKNIKK